MFNNIPKLQNKHDQLLFNYTFNAEAYLGRVCFLNNRNRRQPKRVDYRSQLMR